MIEPEVIDFDLSEFMRARNFLRSANRPRSFRFRKSDNCWSGSIRRFFGSANEVANSLQDGFRIGISLAKRPPADARPTRRDENTKELPDELE